MNEFGIDFNEQMDHIFDIIESLPKTKHRNSARNSYKHLKKAWVIQEIDPAMAVFRCITAVEEASTAIILAMQSLGYENANILKPHDHKHKVVVAQFFKMLETAIVDFPDMPDISFKEIVRDGITSFETQVEFIQNGEKVVWRISPPLEFSISSDNLIVGFTKYFLDSIEGKGFSSLEKYLKESANIRNRILYACEEGCPDVDKIMSGFFPARARECMNMAIGYLLISVCEKRQSFVQQSLNSILININRIKVDNTHPFL